MFYILLSIKNELNFLYTLKLIIYPYPFRINKYNLIKEYCEKDVEVLIEAIMKLKSLE